MKMFNLVLLLIASSSLAHAGSYPCNLSQAQWEADAWLKLKHKTDFVVRSTGTAVGPWSNNLPVKYVFHYSAVPKEPEYASCCGMIGQIVIDVSADRTCATTPSSGSSESSADLVETRDSYSFIDFIKDKQSSAHQN